MLKSFNKKLFFLFLILFIGIHGFSEPYYALANLSYIGDINVNNLESAQAMIDITLKSSIKELNTTPLQKLPNSLKAFIWDAIDKEYTYGPGNVFSITVLDLYYTVGYAIIVVPTSSNKYIFSAAKIYKKN